MAISYNTGTAGTLNNATSISITIPAGVLTGDVMLLYVNLFTETSTAPTVTFSGGGGGWTLIPGSSPGANPQVSASGSIWNYGYAYYRVATAGDPGATLTISESGSPGGTNWFAVALAAYTGANTSAPIDLIGAAANNDASSTVTCPVRSTATSGDWAVYMGGGGVNGNSGTFPGPAGATSRQDVISSAGIGAAIFDSNGSVGAAGTSIGGGTFATHDGANGWLTAFTIGLAPPGGPAPTPENPTPPQIPHPLWWQLLEVAYERADWQAQGVASPVPQHWRLMDGMNGRPGTGSSGTQPPAAGTSNAAGITNGCSFYVSQGGMWFEGYWYYVCASGQATSPQKFALWTTVGNGTGSVVPGTVVTSGTLTAGQWNYVPLPQPVQLAIWGVYVAAVGVPAAAGYPDTANQFGAGQPYANGITSGPLTGFSDLGASNPTWGSFGQSPQSAGGSDPAVNLPGGAQASHDNLWLDVQVTNTAPAGYAGSYRLWPNMQDSDTLTGGDAAVNYVIGTELIISQPVVVNAIWYYVPGQAGANQWATSADIWRVRDGVRVATQSAPTWINPYSGGVDQNSAGGRWVYTQLPGTVYLAPGDYYVTVYNGNGSPNAWSAKRLGYWQQGGQDFTNDGTFKHMPPGTAGITSGPLYAPTTPAASDIADYNTPSIIEPGQSVFAVGPPNQFPDRYVGTPTQLYQNYWVDLEVTPASVFTPDAPDLPQRLPHPLYTQLLEVAAYRADGTQGVASARTAGSVPALMTTRTEVIGRATGRVIWR